MDRISRVFLAVCLSLTAFSVSRAHAAEPKETMGIVLYPFAPAQPEVSKKIVDKTSELLSREFANGDQWTVLPVPAEAGGGGGAAPSAAKGKRDDKALAAVAEARNQVKKAAQLTAKSKFAEAGRAYESALRNYDTGAAELTDLTEVFDAAVKLAEMHFRLSKEGDAQKAFEVAVRLEPAKTLPAGFPPVFIRTYEQVKRRVLSQPRGSVRITGAPGAAIYLDGREIGHAPLVAKEVLRGSHFLRVISGSDVFARRIEVQATAEPLAVDASLAPAPAKAGSGLSGALAANDLEAARKASAGIAKTANADYVLFGAAYKLPDGTGFATWLYSKERDLVAPLPEMNMDDELLGAGIEVGKIADAVLKTHQRWPLNAKSGPLIADKVKKALVAAAEEKSVDVAPAPPPPEEKKPEKRAVVASASPSSEGDDLPPPPPSPVPEKRAAPAPAPAAEKKPLAAEKKPAAARADPGDDLPPPPPVPKDDRRVASAGKTEPKRIEEKKPEPRRVEAIPDEKPVEKKDDRLAAADPGFRSFKASGGSSEKPEEPVIKDEGGGHWWIWLIVGGVAAGAAGGGYYYYASTRPATTGTATVTW